MIAARKTARSFRRYAVFDFILVFVSVSQQHSARRSTGDSSYIGRVVEDYLSNVMGRGG